MLLKTLNNTFPIIFCDLCMYLPTYLLNYYNQIIIRNRPN